MDSKTNHSLSAEETLELISQQWCSLTCLMKLAGVGRCTALNIQNEIAKEAKEKGYYVPTRAVPMEMVVDKLNIDIEYLEKMISIKNNRINSAKQPNYQNLVIFIKK